MEMITLKDIRKSYTVGEQHIEVLKGVSLEIKEGEFVAIMGPSGSGKSTLMNIIGMLDNPTSGEYWLDGESVATLTDDDQSDFRGRKIGFVFQSYNLLPRIDLVSQVSLPLNYQGVSKSEQKKRSKEALEKVGLGERIHNKPNELSGGQQQRVSIARAMVTNPALILADEPTGALDTKTSIEIMNLFTQLNKEGKTIVMITHEPDIAAYAQRTIHIRDGVIAS